MRLTRVVPVVAVALLGLGGVTAVAVPGDGGPPASRERVSAAELKSSVRAAAGFADDSFGNGIFQVSVRRGGVGAGQFTVRTGPANPAGAGHDVLFGQGAPGTSYMIVRDTAAHVDYVQGQMLTHADEVSLDDFPNFTEIAGTTSTTTWFANGITIEQTVAVTGQTAADSRVVATTEIRDGFQPPHSYQIQYLWDIAIGGDDGPVVQPRAAGTPYRPFDPTIGVEQTVAGDAELAAVDNDRNAASPTFAVALSGLDNPQAAPGSVKYVCWADAIFAPLGGYVTDSTRDISGPGSNCLNQTGSADSAALFLWSAGGAAGEVKVAASLRMSPPTPHATTMAAGPISLGSATAKLTDTATGRPVSGRTVTFKTGSQLRCTKITDADGKASCGGLLGGLLGYDVTYTGGAIWAGSTAHGGL